MLTPQHPPSKWVAAAVWATLALTGCSGLQAPQPWEKGDLARAEMRMDGDPLEARFRAHVYASKEGASGGAGVGGGGCGCN
jgi:hypothetical protein